MREEPLASLIVENAAYELETAVGITKAITVGKIEYLIIEFHRLGFFVQDDTAFLFQVAIHPNVMVTGKEMYFHSHVGKFRQFPEEACVTFGYGVFPFVPEVEHVS